VTLTRFDQGHLRLEIDDPTGSIVGISDTGSGRVHFAGDPGSSPAIARLFRVILPVERWSSHAADSWSSGPPEIEATAGRLTLRYRDLRSPRGGSGIAAEVEVSAGGESEVILRLRLASHRRDGHLTDVLFPWLGAWQEGGGAPGTVTLGGVRSLPTAQFPVNRGMTFSRWHQRQFFTYPMDLYAPWLDVSNGDGGVSVISYQRSARNLGAFLENLAGYDPGLALSVGLNHFLEIKDGGTWESPPIGISVHAGDWHATADRYTTWVDSWFRPPPTPEWARRSIGFQNVLFRGFDGTPVRPLASIPEVAAAGVDAGVPHLSVWDYVLLGEYGKLDEVPDHGFALGDRETLQAGLAEARKLGARLSSLQNYRLVNPETRRFREEADAEICRRFNGSPFVEEYCGSLAHAMVITSHVGPMVHPLDARIASVRERVLRLINQTLDLGFDSHFYDQPFETWPSYHPGRGDDQPDGAHAATVSLLAEVRRLIASRSPDGIVIGEYCDVFASEAVDLWMSWYTDLDDLRRSLYSIPQTMQSWVVDSDPAAATRAFAVGAQLCLTTRGGEGHLGEVPAFAAHVRRLADLRARSPRLWRGRFRDATGLAVEADGPVVAGVFASPTGSAIVIGAPGARGRAKLEIDSGRLVSGNGRARLLRFEGTAELDVRDGVAIDLARDEVAILEL
jgi:hypothetical protein